MARHQLALFLRTLGDEFQRAQRSEFYARAHKHLFTVAEYDAKDDANVQIRQIKDSLRDLPAAIVVAPVREELLRATARDAARLGVGWVSLNRTCDYVTDLRREFPKLAYVCVGPDQEDVGRLQAEQIRTLFPKGGRVFYVHGPLSTSSAKRRLASFEAALADSPFRIILGNGDWSEESGYRAGCNWLQTGINPAAPDWCVAAQNDAMAAGVSRSLVEDAAQRKRATPMPLPPMMGCDGLASFGQRLVLERILAATVVIPVTAARAVDEVAGTVRGGKPPAADVRLPVTSFPELDVIARRSARVTRH